MSRIVLPLLTLAMLAACTTSERFAADVTRFHMAPPGARGAVFLEPMQAATATSLEYQNYAGAVANELRDAGFTIADTRSAAEILGIISYAQATREAARKSSPVSIGIGGGTFGGDVGVGVGTSIGVGGKKGGEVNVNTLALQLKRVSDMTVVWEGRAVAEASSDSPYGPLSTAIPELADALLRDFPGTSGQTVTYKKSK